MAAPAGSFVNVTGATSFQTCPVGFFSDTRGTDECDRCPPGQYANTAASRACKVNDILWLPEGHLIHQGSSQYICHLLDVSKQIH
jgi:hypothetical protein